MTISNNFFFRRLARPLRMATALILAGCALWLGLQVPVNHARTVTPVNPLPDLRGHEALEHLKQEGLYNTLAGAVTAARYNADGMLSPDAYRFSNPAQGIRATFTSSGARFVSSKGGRERELTFKLIGYGYGSRMMDLDSKNIVARRNRIEHDYSNSAIPESQSAIKEWFVNKDTGIEHGFTLPEPPPTDRVGTEALRVEMEIGGDFEPRLDAAGRTVTLGCGGGAGGLSFWYYGQNSGRNITVKLTNDQAALNNPAQWKLAWSDEFNSKAGTAPDASVWGREIGDGVAIGNPGWGNDELEYYTDSTGNAATDGLGNLAITAKPADGSLQCYYGPCKYTSARLLTKNRFEIAYGRIEARIKVPRGAGLWPAFWMLGSDIDQVGWPQTGEIDIMENVGRQPNRVFGTLHGPG